MKIFIISILLVLCLTRCTKQYSALQQPNLVDVTVNGTIYPSPILNVAGYWKVTVTLSKPVDEDIRLVYTFDDSQGMKTMDVSHPVSKGKTTNIFSTNWIAMKPTSHLINVKLIRVEGGSKYQYRIN